MTTTAASSKDTEVSEDEATMDAMIEKASVPNLADLFKRGKEAGLITATSVYGGAPQP